MQTTLIHNGRIVTLNLLLRIVTRILFAQHGEARHNRRRGRPAPVT